MRAVRVECAISSIEHDQRVKQALQAISWDYRGTLDRVDITMPAMRRTSIVEAVIDTIALLRRR